MADVYESRWNNFQVLQTFQDGLGQIGVDAERDINIIRAEMNQDDIELQPQIFETIKGAVSVLPKLNGSNVKDKVTGALELIANIAPLLGVIGPSSAIALKLSVKFLDHMWQDEEDIHSYLNYNIEIEEVRSEIVGIEREFRATQAYLSNLLDREDISKDDIDSMLSFMDIKQGAKILGSISCKIKSFISTTDKDRNCTAMTFIALYVRVAVFRSSMLWEICSILRRSSGHSYTLNSVKNIIEVEEKIDKKFLEFLSQPTKENTLFLSAFDPSSNKDVMSFLQYRNIQLQNLQEYLMTHRLSFLPAKTEKFWMNMANNFYGTIWGTSDHRPPSTRIRFFFEPVEEDSNAFYMKSYRWNEWYVYVDDNTYCYGTKEKPGPEGHWKFLKLDEKNVVFFVKKWPGKFIYMEDSLLNKVRRIGTEMRPIEDCLWKIHEQQIIY